MPHPRANPFPTPTTITATSSKKTDKSVASVTDTNYRQLLLRRNIYIEEQDPPEELMRRAQEIVSRKRSSPEPNDHSIRELKQIIRKVQNKGEDELVRQVAPIVIPGFNSLPNEKLARSANQLWSNSVPVPLDPTVLVKSLPLPRPKPDLSFGNSTIAFNKNQLATIDLLVHDQFGSSYAVPDQALQFPFLIIEFKSQAKNGTLHVATNQAAGAGAIVMNSHLELMSRSVGLDNFDFDNPQFFSVTMDHKTACVNVHWIHNQSSTTDKQYSFHLEELSEHLLKDPNGVRALRCAIKNILDYGSKERLQHLHDALDKYREAFLRQVKVASAAAEENREDVTEFHASHQQPRQKGAQLPPRKKAKGTKALKKKGHDTDGPENTQTKPKSRGRPKRAIERQNIGRKQGNFPVSGVRTRRMVNTTELG